MQKNSLIILLEKLVFKGIIDSETLKKIFELDDFILEFLANSPLENFFEKVEVSLVNGATETEIIENIALLEEFETKVMKEGKTPHYFRSFAARIFRDTKIKMQERQALVKDLMSAICEFPKFSDILDSLGEIETLEGITTHLLLITLLKNIPFLKAMSKYNDSDDTFEAWSEYILSEYNSFITFKNITSYEVERTLSPNVDNFSSFESDQFYPEENPTKELSKLIERINSYTDKEIDVKIVLKYLNSSEDTSQN